VHPWYTWAVVAVNGERLPHKYPELSWRGGRYFKVEDRSDPGKVKDYYVVYEDTQLSRSCIDFTQAKTFLTFKGCDECNIDYIYASDILTNKKCEGSTMEKFAISQIRNDCNREDNKTFCIFYPKILKK